MTSHSSNYLEHNIDVMPSNASMLAHKLTGPQAAGLLDVPEGDQRLPIQSVARHDEITLTTKSICSNDIEL
jgi:hypothetical protein